MPLSAGSRLGAYDTSSRRLAPVDIGFYNARNNRKRPH
jgi:hypothetical protein